MLSVRVGRVRHSSKNSHAASRGGYDVTMTRPAKHRADQSPADMCYDNLLETVGCCRAAQVTSDLFGLSPSPPLFYDLRL
ncbi:hypothetical protein BgiMline_007258, partial [Biomphalaria glabrata]